MAINNDLPPPLPLLRIISDCVCACVYTANGWTSWNRSGVYSIACCYSSSIIVVFVLVCVYIDRSFLSWSVRCMCDGTEMGRDILVSMSEGWTISEIAIDMQSVCYDIVAIDDRTSVAFESAANDTTRSGERDGGIASRVTSDTNQEKGSRGNSSQMG